MRQRAVSVLACVLLWCALVLPADVQELTAGEFVRIPLAGLLVLALLLLLPPRMRRTVAAVFALVLAVLLLVKVLDIGFTTVMDRRFHGLYDWSNLVAGFHLLDGRVGRIWSVVLVAVVLLVAAGVVIALVRSALRVTRVVSDHPRVSGRVVTAAALVWALCAVGGVQVSGGSVASTGTARLAHEHATGLYTDYRDREAFARARTEDRFAGTKGDDRLAGLQGKDVLLVFAESYGRVALTHPKIAPGVTDVLGTGTRRLQEAGFSARSGYLTSPTFGAGSWLAHATLQSGLWVDSQQRYDQLLTEDRLTLTAAFERAGWHTPFVLPAVEDGWRKGRSFYHFDTLHDAARLRYRGPELGWGGTPDQYTLSKFWRSTLAEQDRAPVMATIELVSSHSAWPPPPPLVDWTKVGDGSVFDCMPGCARGRSGADVPTRYRESIEYTLETVTSFVVEHGDRDLVVILVGDHQPWKSVTGKDPSHDVPVTIIAHDPAVMRRISDWGWTPGMAPGPEAPVWRMDAFRDRFLTAFRGAAADSVSGAS